MLLSGVFDPIAVKANLALCLKGREQKARDHKNTNQWLVKWSDWSDSAISDKVSKWKSAGCVASAEQLDFTAHVLCYMDILHRAVQGHNSKPNPLPLPFPWFGPIFNHPSVEYRETLMKTSISFSDPFQAAIQQAHMRKMSPLNNPEQFLVEPVVVISPVFYPHLRLDNCPVQGCTAKISKRGFTPTGPRTIYGVEFNIKAIGLEYECNDHGIFSTMSSERFWKDVPPWKCDDIPYFQDRSGCTRELFDLAVELRPRLSNKELTGTISQLHIQRIRRLEKKWLQSALYEKEKFPDQEIKTFPTSVLTLSTGSLKKLNPSPSETFFRDLYEYFINTQRREESSQYTRTLAGYAIGMDATIKVAKKANIYIRTTDTSKKTTKVVSVFDGGLLTGVNEDKELVICELLGTAATVEMVPPLLEFADRCDELGVAFRNQGEICVDRCCDFRRTLVTGVPGAIVTQDLSHLKERIMNLIPKRNSYRKSLSNDISDALILQRSVVKGVPPLYRSPTEQARRLQEVWRKYTSIGNVWITEAESTFMHQVKHVSNGCLQRRDPQRMSTTSYNENVHKQINKLSVGHASSLTTIEGLLMDFMLRYNLRININNLSQSPDSPSRLFRQHTDGSHHLFLIDHILQQRERLTGIKQPRLLNIKPAHRFGLVARTSGSSVTRYPDLNEYISSVPKKEEGEHEIDDAPDDELIFAVENMLSHEHLSAVEVESSFDLETNGLSASNLVEKELSLSTPDDGFITAVPTLKRSSESKLESSSNKVRLLEYRPISQDISEDSAMHVDDMDVICPSSSQLPSSPCLPPSSPCLIASSPSPLNTLDSCKLIPATTLDLSAPGPFVMEATWEPPLLNPESDKTIVSTFSNGNTKPLLSSGSVNSISTIQASHRQSRTMQTYLKHTGKDILVTLNQTTFKDGSAGYWRFAALRAQYNWTSNMLDEDWILASERYNNSSTNIELKFYAGHNFPYDPVQRDSNVLKRFCHEFEEKVRQWKIDLENGKAISSWKKMQLAVDIPERATTVSKGRVIKAKICTRCQEVKDGRGAEKNHPRDNCRDGFPIWTCVPYPLPAGLCVKSKDGNRKILTVDPKTCLDFFKLLSKSLDQEAEGIPTDISLKMRNLQVFESLARKDECKGLTLEQAILRGLSSYDFGASRFKPSN